MYEERRRISSHRGQNKRGGEIFKVMDERRIPASEYDPAFPTTNPAEFESNDIGIWSTFDVTATHFYRFASR